MDSETLYVLDEIIEPFIMKQGKINTPIDDNPTESLLRMLTPYRGKNHILYV